MGKENKDYCHEYRVNNLKKYREADRLRKLTKRAAEKLLKPEVYKKKKEADAKRKKLYRQRKKLGLVNPKKKLDDPSAPQADSVLTEASSDEPVATSTPQPSPRKSSSFTTKQSKCRSVSRAVKALPNSPNKRKEVCFSKWGKDDDGNVSKIKMNMDVDDANDLWKREIPKLKSHSFIVFIVRGSR